MMSFPEGFLLSGIQAGIKTEPAKDLGLIHSDRDAIVAGVFTQNKFPSAHVEYCRTLVPGGPFRSLIVNSGNANAATGQMGIDLNLRMVSSLAKKMNVKPRQVLSSSTGIIGHMLPIDKIENSLDLLIEGLKPELTDFAEAILTTDTRIKTEVSRIALSQGTYTIAGVAKGSGMIHPNMATMLAYIITDAPLSLSEIQPLALAVTEKSFNRVSVDGDTSTNDTFLLISNNPRDDVLPEDMAIIHDCVSQVAISLAKQIAGDGEGAEHLIEVKVSGASSQEMARSVLNAILTSNLVKTAVHGKDPNWGRVLMAMGNGLKGFPVENNVLGSISIQDCPVYVKGNPVEFDAANLSVALDSFDVSIVVDLHMGEFTEIGWGCDLTSKYVQINAEYST